MLKPSISFLRLFLSDLRVTWVNCSLSVIIREVKHEQVNYQL